MSEELRKSLVDKICNFISMNLAIYGSYPSVQATRNNRTMQDAVRIDKYLSMKSASKEGSLIDDIVDFLPKLSANWAGESSSIKDDDPALRKAVDGFVSNLLLEEDEREKQIEVIITQSNSMKVLPGSVLIFGYKTQKERDEIVKTHEKYANFKG